MTQGTFLKTVGNPDHGAGVVEVIGCHIENHDAQLVPQRILSNSGHATFNECVFSKREQIYQFPGGTMDIMFSTLAADVRVETAAGSTTRLTRVTLAQGFPYPGTDSLHDGSWEFPDAKRSFRHVPSDDPLCNGTTLPCNVLEGIQSPECKLECEVDSLCSGFLSFLDSTGIATCDLSFNPTPIPYNCELHAGTSYMIAESRLDFFEVSSCPAATANGYDTITRKSIEICKVYCSFYDICEGFQVVHNGQEYDCTFYSGLQFETGTCANPATIYIPYVKGSTGFTKVNGISVSAPIANKALPHDQCYALCQKTLTCKAIYVNYAGNCIFYDGTSKCQNFVANCAALSVGFSNSIVSHLSQVTLSRPTVQQQWRMTKRASLFLFHLRSRKSVTCNLPVANCPTRILNLLQPGHLNSVRGGVMWTSLVLPITMNLLQRIVSCSDGQL